MRKNPRPAATRRQLLGAGCGLGAFAMLGLPSVATLAQDAPVNTLSGQEALDKLMEGNRRYAQSERRLDQVADERRSLTSGQAPYAAILACSDSRVAPELLFDQPRGALFVVRVAGNFLTEEGLASLEYTVAVLGTSLILVLGHQNCGAVAAAIDNADDPSQLPGHLPQLVRRIEPAVRAAEGKAGDLLANTIAQNALIAEAQLRRAHPIVADAVSSGKVLLKSGVYDLEDGRVSLLG